MNPARAASVVAIVALLACASPPDGSATTRVGTSAQTLLVLPLNVAVTPPEEIAGPSDRVWEELSAYLQAHGKRVQTVASRDAQQLWLAGIHRIKSGAAPGPPNFDAAARLFVQELDRQLDFDAVIMPSVFIQEATLSGRWAYWDGVTRRVEIDRDVRRIGSIVTSTDLVGTTPAASLHVVVLAPDGEKVHEEQAGLELLMRMTVEGQEGAPASELQTVWELRSDLFQGHADVREGVAMALDPFLPIPPESSLESP